MIQHDIIINFFTCLLLLSLFMLLLLLSPSSLDSNNHHDFIIMAITRFKILIFITDRGKQLFSDKNAIHQVDPNLSWIEQVGRKKPPVRGYSMLVILGAQLPLYITLSTCWLVCRTPISPLSTLLCKYYILKVIISDRFTYYIFC